jgi:ACT domain-containing protein
MKVYIDGKEMNYINDVKIISEAMGDDDDVDLHLTFNNEGMIVDFIKEDDVCKSSWYFYDNMISNCY